MEITVVDATTGVDICDATALATPNASDQPSKLDESGMGSSCAYTLAGGIVGDISLEVSAPGYEKVSIPVTLTVDSCNHYPSTYQLAVKLKASS